MKVLSPYYTDVLSFFDIINLTLLAQVPAAHSPAGIVSVHTPFVPTVLIKVVPILVNAK